MQGSKELNGLGRNVLDSSLQAVYVSLSDPRAINIGVERVIHIYIDTYLRVRQIDILPGKPQLSPSNYTGLHRRHSYPSNQLIKSRNQRLRQPKTKHQLRPRHQQLGRQPLKERPHALLPRHLPQYPEPALRVFEIPVLDARFDDVEGGGDEEGGGGAGDGGDEVLGPGCAVVVGEGVEVLFCGCGAAEELGGRRGLVCVYGEMGGGYEQRMTQAHSSPPSSPRHDTTPSLHPPLFGKPPAL